MNNAVFGKIMENVVKHGDIELEITNKIRNYLVSEPNYHTTKLFSKNLLVKLNMPVPAYLGLSILQISKKLMFEFWYDYVKPKYQHYAKLCYMDTDSFIIHIKTEDVCKNIANDIEKWFDISNYDVNRSFPPGK